MTLPKTAIIGATGFMGKVFLEEHRKIHPQCIGTSKDPRAEGFFFLDLAAPSIASLRLVETGHQNAIILAGMTKLAICEKEKEFTRKINVEGTLDLVRQFFREGIKPIFFSSDIVFENVRGPHDDEAIPNPLNEYGRQKAEVELGIKEICRNGNYLIVRLCKTFSLDKGSGTLLDEMAATLSSGGIVRAAYDQIFSPIFILDLIKIVTILQIKDVRGVINVSSPEIWSRYDLALALANCMNVNPSHVEKISLDDLKEPFKRPKNTTMKIDKVLQKTNYKFPPTLQYIKKIADNWREKDRPYIDFYTKYKISPVAQDISDFRKHYDRREFLYRRLGIVSSFVKDKSVIEFGPGSGHNALYTYSLNPSQYVLVDGNPTGLNKCRELFRDHFPQGKHYEFVECFIEQYKSDELFDLVICEGVIPAQNDPKQFAKTIARFTKPGGVCLMTCHDEVGMFTDLLRCLIGTIVIEESMTFKQKVEILVTVFEKQLKNLKGMSRSCKDWVIDQIINKALWRDSSLFSINDAIDALDDSFDVYGVSPFFLTDWRWYKDVFGEKRAFNSKAKDCYWKNIHNFLDCRYEFQPQSVEENKKLLNHCHKIWKLIALYGHDRKKEYIDEICREMVELEAAVRAFSPMTAEAITDFLHTLKMYPQIDQATDWGRFSAWWGRGMQYLSFIRRT